jgi:ubiquinone/menaquinone biosynthesis C-methylase UbiE
MYQHVDTLSRDRTVEPRAIEGLGDFVLLLQRRLRSIRPAVDWKKNWDVRTDGGHIQQTPEFLAREGWEKMLYLGGGDRLLDFGCGSADLLQHYAPHFRESIGIDQSGSMLKEARRKMDGVANVTLLQGNQDTVWREVAGRFDRVTAAGVLHYLTAAQTAAWLAAAKGRLTLKGQIILFDVMHPQRRTLRRFGVGFERAPLRRIAYLALRQPVLRIARLIRPSARDNGFAYSPRFFRNMARQLGMDVEFVMSAFYDYRYHVILTQGASSLGAVAKVSEPLLIQPARVSESGLVVSSAMSPAN